MRAGNLTRRYVLVVEYSCGPQKNDDQQGRCHGWVRYQQGITTQELRQPFNHLDQLPELIHELMAYIDRNT